MSDAMSEEMRARVRRVRKAALLLAVVGLIACALGGWLAPVQYLRSHLYAFVFWTGISLGCALMVMIHHVLGGAWGVLLRRILEAGAFPVLVMALLIVPILLGMRHLYPWVDAPPASSTSIMGQKSLYLNVPFFTWRAIGYLLVWAILAFLLSHLSLRQDLTTDQRPTKQLHVLSVLGLILFTLTITFAAIDWIMSLDPHWFSSIYGVIVLVGQGIGGLAFAVACLAWMSPDRPLSELLDRDRLIDIGNLMMAGVVLWAYVSFAQFLIIWSGNVAEEVPWYVRRSYGGWQWVSVLLALLHFLVPFFLLLMRDIKSNVRLLGAIAGLVLLMHAVDVFYLVMPEFYAYRLRINLLDVVVLLAVGALWLALFAWRLGAGGVLPVNDPSMQEMKAHG